MQVDITHADLEADIAPVVVKSSNDFLTNSLKDIIDKHEHKGRKSLEVIYEKLRDMFEGTSTKTSSELPTRPDVAKEISVPINASREETTLTSAVPQLNTHVTSTPNESGSARNIGSGSQDVSAFVRRQRLSQGWYRCTERNAKERKVEGKKPFLVEVSKYGEPIGQNAARWASELGTRCRAHLDICKSNFSDQDPRIVDNVIQKMENSFETIGGQISRKFYKQKMRILMNSYRYNCRKIIIEGKDKTDSTISPKQWEALKESMRSEEYLSKRNRGMKARDNVRATYTFGRGGL